MMHLDCIWGVSLFLSLSLGWAKAQQTNFTRWGHSTLSVRGEAPLEITDAIDLFDSDDVLSEDAFIVTKIS